MNGDFILEVLKVLFPAGVGALGTGTLFAILLVLYPEKIEKWQAIPWGLVEKAGLLYKRASKERIRHSIQGRVSSFARNLGYRLPEFNPPRIRIDWVDEKVDRKAFLDQGKAVIRLRRQDPNNENVATACMFFVSQILLRKAGRYLSPTQKQSVELYVGYRMLQEEQEEVLDVFVDRWLYPGIEESNEKVSQYFDRYQAIDQAEFFLPIFLQELVYMGEKVFGKKRDGSIVQEVDGALQFLEVYASRRIGEKTDRPYFNGNTCCFAIMIVGISANIEEERYDIYLKHIRDSLIRCEVETIYMIGPSENRGFMRKIARKVDDKFSNPFSRSYGATILNADGERVQTSNHLSVLRKRGREQVPQLISCLQLGMVQIKPEIGRWISAQQCAAPDRAFARDNRRLRAGHRSGL